MTGNVFILSLVLWPFIGAFICYLIGWVKGNDKKAQDRKKLRDLFVCGVIIFEFVLFMFCVFNSKDNGITLDIKEICGFGIGFQFGGFRRVYVVVALLMWLMTGIFSLEYFEHYRNRNRYYFFYLLTLGATVGVFLSKDLYTAFIFFEIMSLTSYTWVAHEENPKAMRAAGTYLAVAVIGGLVMLMGLMMLYHKLGTLEISRLYYVAAPFLNSSPENQAYIYVAGALILFGYGAKAGMFPLHIWLPKAHPVAPAPASALLSGILTKSGIYGVLVLCFEVFRGNENWGTVILILGVVTMFLGAVLAVFSIDLKRTLACSSMSQIGFILTGCAISVFLNEENSLAAGGTVLYMVNHSLFKLILFMCAGAIYMKLHKLDLNEIRGFGRGKWLLMICFGVGALGIMGVPMFSGYISKTLIHEGIVEYYHELTGTAATLIKTVEYLFLASGGMTIGYMVKLFIAIFIEKPEKQQKETTPIKDTSYYAMIIPALIVFVCGAMPEIYIEKLAVLMSDFTHAEPIEGIELFSLENLKGFFISLVIGAVVYLFIRTCLMSGKKGQKVYVDRWPAWLDLENLIYRPVILKALPAIFGGIFKVFVAIFSFDWVKVFFKELVENKAHPMMDKMANKLEISDRNIRIVVASISFSMVCMLVGIIITLVYLLAR